MQQVGNTETARSLITSLIQNNKIALNNNNNNNTTSSSIKENMTLQNDTKNLQISEFSKDQRIRFIIEFSAGAIGGAVSRTAYVFLNALELMISFIIKIFFLSYRTAPIDRLRTVFQVQSVDLNKNEINMRKIWDFMIKEGKWQGLWRGNCVNVIKTAPENAIRLATYEKFKTIISKNKNSNEITFGEKVLCGSAAGFLGTLVLYPLKTVKTLMNLANTGEFTSIIDCISKVYNRHGIRAFYRGLVCNSLAIIPSAGIDLATYETLKQNYSKFMNKTEPSVVEKIILGNFSSCIGNLIIYPLLFARTRLQSNRNPNETTINLLIKVFKRDGVPGMYRGFLLHILKIGPAASISYVTFESVTKAFSINSLS